ncbi:hypothetical protein MUP77_23615 [Candidatus Bathyarchaeota archaeon]|nr:hypothetical protein [Candidatus Bathyarchaeota archaeon]
MSCPICGIVAEKRLCQAHERSYQNLVEAYEVWNHALGIKWRDYLEKVERNPDSGKWVKDICVFLLQNEDGEESKA